MTCRCGYEFCYVCGGKYQECECPLYDDYDDEDEDLYDQY